MPYTPQDKYEMSLRQAKVDIGQGRGNSMTNAINWAIANKLSLDEAFAICDKIFHYSQVKIDTDYTAWFEANDRQLKIDTGLEPEVINEGEDL